MSHGGGITVYVHCCGVHICRLQWGTHMQTAREQQSSLQTPETNKARYQTRSQPVPQAHTCQRCLTLPSSSSSF